MTCTYALLFSLRRGVDPLKMEVRGLLEEEKESLTRIKTTGHLKIRTIELPLQDLMQKPKGFKERRQNLTRTKIESSDTNFILNQTDLNLLISS